MGRSSYTASTVSHLAHAAGSSSSGSSSYAGESSHNKLDALSSIMHDISSSSIATTSTRPFKDAPAVWAQKAFDPDDESLPAVEERFLEPYEEIPQLDNQDTTHHDEDEEEDDDVDLDLDEDDDDDESRWDDEGDEAQAALDTAELRLYAQGLTTRGASLQASSTRSSAAIAELAQALMGTQAPPAQTSHYRNQRYQAQREHATMHESDHQHAEEADEDYDEPPHGNGGYYDYGYSREDEQVIDERSTPSIVDDFSPSAGVFHRHTLPFNLPNMGEMQLQRRTSNTIINALPTSTNSTYAF